MANPGREEKMKGVTMTVPLGRCPPTYPQLQVDRLRHQRVLVGQHVVQLGALFGVLQTGKTNDNLISNRGNYLKVRLGQI